MSSLFTASNTRRRCQRPPATSAKRYARQRMTRARSGARPAAGGARDAPLKRYRAKRDFDATPEPGRERPPPAEAPRRASSSTSTTRSRLHWDLRLERDGVLASWAIPKGLPESPARTASPPHTEDHPLEYLDFDGEIPRGRVRRRDDHDLGPRHLRLPEVGAAQGRGGAPRRAPRRPLRAVPDRQGASRRRTG